MANKSSPEQETVDLPSDSSTYDEPSEVSTQETPAKGLIEQDADIVEIDESDLQQFSTLFDSFLKTPRQKAPVESHRGTCTLPTGDSRTQKIPTVPALPEQHLQPPAHHSEKDWERLRSQLKKTETELAKKARDLRAAQLNVTLAREETNKVKAKQESEVKRQRDELIAKHREEIEQLNIKAGKDAKELKKIRMRLDKLRNSNEKVKILLEAQEKHENEKKYLLQEKERLQERCHHLFKLYERQRIDKLHAIEEKYEILNEADRFQEQLEKLKGKQNPLLLVGVAVRRRFFEQARAVVPQRQIEDEDNEDDLGNYEGPAESGWGAPNKATIDEGNAAAHRGNADADNALFQLGYLKDDYMNHTIQGELFMSMYGVYPLMDDPLEAYYSARLRKIFNIEATARTVITSNNAAKVDVEKKILLDRLTSLANKLRYEENEQKEADEIDLELENELDQLVEEAEQISMDFIEKFRKR